MFSLTAGALGPSIVCVLYYCRTYYKAVRVGGGGEWRTCAMRDDKPRPVWMSLLITHLVSDLEGSNNDDPLYGIIYCR